MEFATTAAERRAAAAMGPSREECPDISGYIFLFVFNILLHLLKALSAVGLP
jgi:hypothetical protein